MLTWKLLKVIAKDGEPMTGNFEAYQLHIGQTGSSKRIRHALVVDRKELRLCDGNGVRKLKDKNPEQLQEVMRMLRVSI